MVASIQLLCASQLRNSRNDGWKPATPAKSPSLPSLRGKMKESMQNTKANEPRHAAVTSVEKEPLKQTARKSITLRNG